MPTVDVNGETLFYAETGQAPSPALALVHGAGENHLIWPGALRRMEGVRVLALDLPGHNRSGGEGRRSVAEYAGVVRAFLDALEIERAVICGHSMGGAIAQQFGLDYAGRARGLVLVGTGARLRVMAEIREGMLTQPDAAIDLITRMEWGPGTPPDLREKGREQLRKERPEVAAGDYEACHAFDVMARLGEIKAPTLVVGGTADQMTAFKYSEFLAAQIPGAKLARIEGGGHMMMLEQPDEVARCVREFLRELLP